MFCRIGDLAGGAGPFRALLMGVALWVAFAPVAGAEGTVCDAAPVTVVTGTPDVRSRICDAVSTAADLLAYCELPLPTDALTIDVTDDVEPACFGIYHCDEKRIVLLPPSGMEQLRTPEDVFADIDGDAFFASIVVHEFAHAVMDGVPCPPGGCRAANEYLSYTLQLMSLPSEAREVFEQRYDMERPVTPDMLSSLMTLLAPGVFAQRAWAHLQQQPDPCAFLREVAAGRVFLGRDLH